MSMHVLFGEWTIDDVVVLELSAREWRVSDLRRRECDGMAVLGIIERDGRRFTVTALASPWERPAFEHFDEAVRFLERFCAEEPRPVLGEADSPSHL
jgi:hypothetical protein